MKPRLEGILLFVVLQICLRVFRLHERPGLISAIFLFGYGALRFVVEFFREPDTPFLGWFSMGQALSVGLLAAGSYLAWYRAQRAESGVNALGQRIAALIAAQGPISIAEFMTIALHDPQAGYYATRDPLGAAGDFITAPEISQMFGEFLGLWCVQVWHDQGKPARKRLVELGPGRGTLDGRCACARRGSRRNFSKGSRSFWSRRVPRCAISSARI